MITLELIKIAKVIYAEGGIFSGKNYNALLAIAQCIHDLLPSYKDLNACLASAFTTPSDQYDPQCLQAAHRAYRKFLYASIHRVCSRNLCRERRTSSSIGKRHKPNQEDFVLLQAESLYKRGTHRGFGSQNRLLSNSVEIEERGSEVSEVFELFYSWSFSPRG